MPLYVLYVVVLSDTNSVCTTKTFLKPHYRKQNDRNNETHKWTSYKFERKKGTYSSFAGNLDAVFVIHWKLKHDTTATMNPNCVHSLSLFSFLSRYLTRSTSNSSCKFTHLLTNSIINAFILVPSLKVCKLGTDVRKRYGCEHVHSFAGVCLCLCALPAKFVSFAMEIVERNEWCACECDSAAEKFRAKMTNKIYACTIVQWLYTFK